MSVPCPLPSVGDFLGMRRPLSAGKAAPRLCYAAPPHRLGFGLPCAKPRVALWSRFARHAAPVTAAPPRPPARWLVTPSCRKGQARSAVPLAPLRPLRFSLAAGLPRGSVFPPFLPSGGSRPALRAGARGFALRAPLGVFRALRRAGVALLRSLVRHPQGNAP